MWLVKHLLKCFLFNLISGGNSYHTQPQEWETRDIKINEDDDNDDDDDDDDDDDLKFNRNFVLFYH